MPIPSSRLGIAKKRIISVLEKRHYANIRQLESKISESGPFNQRCDPHVITQALNELSSAGLLSKRFHPQNGTVFYYLPVMDTKKKFQRVLEERAYLIDELYAQFLGLTQQYSLCGEALETVVRSAFAGSEIFIELGSKASPLGAFNGRDIPGALDGTFIHQEKNFLVAVEAKNTREWIYPSSQEIWGLIHKANAISTTRFPVLPVLICRKIPFYAFIAFKQLGVLGYEIHSQFFDPSVADQLVDIKDKTRLGFHDVKTDLSPPSGLLKFLNQTIGEQGPDSVAKFLRHKPILDQVAPRLADKKLSNSDRAHYWQLVKAATGITAALEHHE